MRLKQVSPNRVSKGHQQCGHGLVGGAVTEADTVLNKRLDKLVYQFKDSASDFFNGYQTVRSIVYIRGGRKKNDTPTPAPMPTPA
jgi:hypothetical protein